MACPFGGERIRSRGPEDSDLVVVGEAPGAQEILKGVPFIGPSGKLLWDTLAKVGLPDASEKAFVTNALRCRPPSGPIPESAVDSCRPRLREEVSRAQRTVVLALGNTANRSLFQDRNFKITQQRGSVREWTDAEGRKTTVIPVLHPAAILRNPGDYPKFRADLAYAVSVYQGGEIRSPGETRYTLVRDDQIPRAIQALTKCDVLACDIETTGYNPRSDKIISLGVAWKRNTVLIFTDEQIDRLHPLFAADGPRFVWHNGKFDTAFLQVRGLPARVDDDTMLLHYALDETKGGHGLKDLSSDILGAGDYDKALKRYLPNKATSFAVIPKPVLHTYLAKDADYTLQLYEYLRPRVAADPQLEKLYTRLFIPASAFLQRVERNGMPVDVTGLEGLGESLHTVRRDLAQELVALADAYWNPERYAQDTGAATYGPVVSISSPKQLQWLIYTGMRLKPSKRAELNTSKETLALLPQVQFIKRLRALRKVDKVISTYVEGTLTNVESDGRVHSTYLVHGTVTGRLSSRGPNLQNIPRNPTVRRIFAAPVGRVLVDVDFASHELRCLAHLSGDPGLIDVFINDRDLHDEVTRSMYGLDKATADPISWTEARIRAKAVNFGIAYGRGASSLAYEFDMPISEAQRLVDSWFEQFPVAKEFLERCRNIPKTGGVLVTPFGRKRRWLMPVEENLVTAQNEAANFPISSLASDLTLLSAMRMEQQIDGLGAQIVNLVHDSIIIECDDDSDTIRQVIDVALSTMAETPKQAIRARLEFGTEAKVGRQWGELTKWKDTVEPAMVGKFVPPATPLEVLSVLAEWKDDEEEAETAAVAAQQSYRTRQRIGG
jgi:DNA polymerase-1